MSNLKPSLAEHFWPQQVAMAIPSGITLLVFGMRSMMELHPEWVIVRLDLRNAYNEIKRASVLQRLLDSPNLQCLAPLFHATHSVSSPIFLAADGLHRAAFDSEEGVQQGDGPASASFCAGIHPEVKALDSELAAHGGAARFIMDDGYAIGPPQAVFAAVRRFGCAVRNLGLELQESKCACYCPAGPGVMTEHRPISFPIGQFIDSDGSSHGFGVPVGGIPVGDNTYVQCYLTMKAAKAVSKIDSVTDALQPLHIQSLHSAAYFGLNSLFDHM
eukprot:5830296-Karenia_brevis.AAC.1